MSMQERNDPGYHRAVSLHLSRVLDEVGLNTFTVKKRRGIFLWKEQVGNLQDRLKGMNHKTYHFGSQTEGATTPGMYSDLDQLDCPNICNVIEDWVDWKQGKLNLLMLHEDTAPGYCRLQLLRSDVPMAREDFPGEHFTYDSSGRVIMKNTLIHSLIGTCNMLLDRSGPAASQSDEPGSMAHDYVYAYKCNTWPTQAAEFTRRHRCHGWPSQRLLEEAVSHGVFLVPVGYKLSPTEPLEWRISASMAERCLMFSLTIVHIKCYTVLKILVKSFIEPHVQKCISSYHCKTALLHCTETTESGFWREDNLLQCITRCLEILRNWVADLFCPQFIISGENLFAGKVTVHNRELLLFIITWLINGDGRALLYVQMDGIGHKLQSKLNTEHSCIPIMDMLASVKLVGQLERNMHGALDEVNRSLIVDNNNKKQIALIQSVRLQTTFLKEIVGRAVKYERRAIQTVIPLLSCWLGSLLASLSLSHNRRIPRQTIQLMSTAVNYDIASMLKLASVFYCSGKFGKVEYILQNIENHFRRNDMLVICRCYPKLTVLPHEFSHMMYALRGKKARAKLIAHCVRFSRHEIHCVPRALRHEMYREIGDDTQHRDPNYDTWMVLAVVDCLPYLYYLQYLTYKQLEIYDLRRQSLHNLDRCVREDKDFGHLETTWNLLGQCREDEQDPDAAMTCYRISLQLRPRNNAANWHVAMLWYKLIKNHDLLPGVAGGPTEKKTPQTGM